MNIPSKSENEDYVDFRIYVGSINDEERLQSYCSTLRAQLHALGVGDYIWQRDSMVVRLVSAQNDLMCIGGSVRVGDCIDDEWFVVYALLQVTARAPKSDALVISVSDADGQFLLIESALVLPDWLKPENSENRVFLHDGKLHIVPLPTTPAHLGTLPPNPTLTQALSLVRGEDIITEADKKVQKVIQARLAVFPAYLRRENAHHAFASLGERAAHVLHIVPQLIAPAVVAFYYRDIDSMRACNRMRVFGGAYATRMLRRRVRFTRCLYAQLDGQRFYPPKRSGLTLPARDSPSFHAALLGVKIMCGLEMVYGAAERQRRLREQGKLDDGDFDVPLLTENAQWRELCAQPSSAGKTLQQLTMLRNYVEQCYQDDALLQGDLIDAALRIDVDVPLTDDGDSLGADDTDWLHVDARQVDAMVARMQLSEEDMAKMLAEEDLDSAQAEEADGAEAHAADKDAELIPEAVRNGLDEMAKMMSDFVEHGEGGLDGAEPRRRGDGDAPNFDEQRLLALLGGALNMNDVSSDGAVDDDLEEAEVDDEEEAAERRRDREYDEALEHELSGTEMAKSFLRENVGSVHTGDDGDADSEAVAPVNVDLNLVANLVESYVSQEGAAGPVSSFLAELRAQQEQK